jgi:DNA polymerase III delta subunit
MYIDEIVRGFDFEITYINSLSEISADDDLFGDSEDASNNLFILNTDLVDSADEMLYNKNNIIVLANKIDKASKKFYGDLVIEIPKLETWQIKDMVYSFMKGVDTKHLDWLIQVCNEDVNRLYQESLKLKMFNESERKMVFNEMLSDGAFGDLSSNTIFNFTNSVLRKDINGLKTIYEEIDNIDINDFGLLSILYNNFLNVIHIQMGISPTPESLGMKSPQFNAIRRNCGYYSSAQLVNIFKLLTDMDRRVKSGEFPTNIMRDYLILSILSQ